MLMRRNIFYCRMESKIFTQMAVIYATFLLFSVAGCTTLSTAPSVDDDYRGDSASAVKHALQDQGMTCFYSDLVITEGNGQSVLDPEKRKLNCYSLEKKWLCPEKTSVTFIYIIESDRIMSKIPSSKEKQCF